MAYLELTRPSGSKDLDYRLEYEETDLDPVTNTSKIHLTALYRKCPSCWWAEAAGGYASEEQLTVNGVVILTKDGLVAHGVTSDWENIKDIDQSITVYHTVTEISVEVSAHINWHYSVTDWPIDSTYSYTGSIQLDMPRYSLTVTGADSVSLVRTESPAGLDLGEVTGVSDIACMDRITVTVSVGTTKNIISILNGESEIYKSSSLKSEVSVGVVVTADTVITVVTDYAGSVYIGSDRYIPYVYDGSGWVRCIPEVYSGSEWVQCGG